MNATRLAGGRAPGEGADDDALEARGRQQSQHLVADRGDVGDDHGRGGGIDDLGAQLARDIERVVVDHHGAGFQRGIVEDHEIRGVRQAQADAVARPDAQTLKAGGGAIDQGGKLRVGPVPPLERQRRAVAERGGGSIQKRRNRQLLKLLMHQSVHYVSPVGVFPHGRRKTGLCFPGRRAPVCSIAHQVTHR